MNQVNAGLPLNAIQKLQPIQNAVDGILLEKPFHFATPLLQELHRLPVVFQTQFKVLIIPYMVKAQVM